MREVKKRSRRVKDIVRNRNYRQAVDVIEREVKRLEADDKPRARGPMFAPSARRGRYYYS
ncbi:hypothetical protein N39L_43870 [Limnospira platensis NIES-39]|uniref:Uncharacterized protein n=1 Tax=Limnospira platensis NIES-46 TaxID=1236695 RepID=A0A5M3TDB7_LIMPL|nr:hypothetical protein N39L_43870 [Arthrospira platensis NIES-39]GCE95499.1 hypothetical protein NIES46_35640 [Arthrospira platensis NIES-46]